MLTHETLLEPDTLETLVARMVAEPRLGAIGPLIGWLSRPEVVFSAGGALLSATWENPHNGMYEPLADWRGRGPLKRAWLDGACVLARAQALREAGPLELRYFHYYDDVHLGVRLNQLAGGSSATATRSLARSPGRSPSTTASATGSAGCAPPPRAACSIARSPATPAASRWTCAATPCWRSRSRAGSGTSRWGGGAAPPRVRGRQAGRRAQHRRGHRPRAPAPYSGDMSGPGPARSVKIADDERGGWSSDRPRRGKGPERPADISTRCRVLQPADRLRYSPGSLVVVVSGSEEEADRLAQRVFEERGAVLSTVKVRGLLAGKVPEEDVDAKAGALLAAAAAKRLQAGDSTVVAARLLDAGRPRARSSGSPRACAGRAT
jgi:hypothetical protein